MPDGPDRTKLPMPDGEYGDRYLGVAIPPTNIHDNHRQTARELERRLADRVAAEASAADDRDLPRPDPSA